MEKKWIAPIRVDGEMVCPGPSGDPCRASHDCCCYETNSTCLPYYKRIEKAYREALKACEVQVNQPQCKEDKDCLVGGTGDCHCEAALIYTKLKAAGVDE